MKYRQLQNSDLKLSEIGLGCASYWGQKYFSERQAIKVVHHAIEQGITYLDTGHSYSGGHAEKRLGKALQQVADKDNLVVSSKVGTRVGTMGRLHKDFSPQWIKQSCEQSLQRLQIDHLPMLFLHGPNPEDFNDETYRVLTDLQQTGKVGMVGVNSFNDDIIKTAADSQQFQCIMLDYSILLQHRKDTMHDLKQQKIDVLVAGAIAGGLYDRRFKKFRGLKSVWYWLRAYKNNRSLLQQAKRYYFLNDQETGSAVQLALAFVLHSADFCSALVGTTSVTHLDELIGASKIQPEEQLMALIAAQAS